MGMKSWRARHATYCIILCAIGDIFLATCTQIAFDMVIVFGVARDRSEHCFEVYSLPVYAGQCVLNESMQEEERDETFKAGSKQCEQQTCLNARTGVGAP